MREIGGVGAGVLGKVVVAAQADRVLRIKLALESQGLDVRHRTVLQRETLYGARRERVDVVAWDAIAHPVEEANLPRTTARGRKRVPTTI